MTMNTQLSVFSLLFTGEVTKDLLVMTEIPCLQLVTLLQNFASMRRQ